MAEAENEKYFPRSTIEDLFVNCFIEVNRSFKWYVLRHNQAVQEEIFTLYLPQFRPRFCRNT